MLPVYACQIDIAWEDKPRSFARVRELLEQTAPERGGLIVLPEMFATGFSMNARAIAEPAETGPTAAFLAEIALGYGCHVMAGVVTVSESASEDRPRNEALLVAPDGAVVGRYAKQRPFTPSGERDCYGAGDSPVVWDIAGVRIAPLICYDLRFPELFRRALDLDSGVDAFVVIASWPGARIGHWSALLRARAIENQAYVIGVNRVGDDPTPLSYPGRSVLLDPSGASLNEAGEEQTVLFGALDPAHVAAYRGALPFLADR